MVENEVTRAREATRKHSKDLLKIPGVQLVYTRTKIKAGLDTKQPATVVCVEKKLPPSALKAFSIPMVPAELNGTVTDVIEIGKLTAPPPTSKVKLLGAADHQKRYRPKVPGGVTAIEYCSSACTLTAWPWSDALKEPVALQCWHCCRMKQCNEGWILQPSPYDAGSYPEDVIAQFLAGDIENPKTDSGISRQVQPGGFATMDIFGLGSFKGAIVPEVDDQFVKSGRTTGITKNSVIALDGSANVSYPDKVRYKEDLIVTGKMLEGGDSSSPARVVRDGVVQPPLAGQGFAGSDFISLFIKIPNIINDPALAPFRLNFDYQYEEPSPPPPPPGDPWEEFLECAEKAGGDWGRIWECFVEYLRKMWPFRAKVEVRRNKVILEIGRE